MSVSCWIPLLITLFLFSPSSLSHGQIDDRIKGLDQKITGDPDEPMLYLMRADLHREHGDWASASTDIQRAAEFSPDNPNLDYYNAALQRDRGDLAESVRSLHRYLERASDWPGPKVPLTKALGALARVYEQQDRACDAADQYGRVIAIAENPAPQLYLSRARLMMRCDPAGYEAALGALDEGIVRFGPAGGPLEATAIEFELGRGRADLALDRQDRQIQRTPHSPAAWIRRAEILERAGRPREALAAYRRAEQERFALPLRSQRAPAVRKLQDRIDRSIERLTAQTLGSTSSPPRSQ